MLRVLTKEYWLISKKELSNCCYPKCIDGIYVPYVNFSWRVSNTIYTLYIGKHIKALFSYLKSCTWQIYEAIMNIFTVRIIYDLCSRDIDLKMEWTWQETC